VKLISKRQVVQILGGNLVTMLVMVVIHLLVVQMQLVK
jgi:hypothetical protein